MRTVAGLVLAVAGLLLAGCGGTSTGSGDAADVPRGGDVVFPGDGKTPDEDARPVDLGTTCTEGKTVCSGPLTVMECKDGKWALVQECVDGNTCIGGKCTLCEEGKTACQDDKQVAKCTNGKWGVFTICPDTHFCSGGTCVEYGSCEPGTIDGCYSLGALKQCNPEGTAFVPVDCPEGEKCANGKCGVLQCIPGQAICAAQNAKRVCKDDGSGFGDPVDCGEGLLCVGGKCLSQCMSDPKWNNSYIGCEYWSLDLDNYPDPFSPTQPDEAPHGVILGNPGTAPATVSFYTFAPDIQLGVGELVIPAGEVAVVEMPRMDVDGSVITNRSVRINSNRPVVAYQFNPLNFSWTFSNDSSLLIPAEMVGKEYYILTMPTAPLEAMPMMGFPSQHGYFTVLAIEPGKTNVSVQVTCKADPPDGSDQMLVPGSTYNYTLDQGYVLNLQATGKELSMNTDLSGSHVVADRKVVVFAGHEEAVIQGLEFDPFTGEPADCCCAEHLEEQLFPLDTWSNHYICAKARPRGPSDLDLWRIQAGQANVTIKTTPPIEGLDGKTISQKGGFVEAFSKESFVVEANGPIQVAQYLSSQTCTEDATGDPDLIMAVAESQYRTPYVFAVPKDYKEDYITVVKPAGGTVTLDGNVLPQGEFTPVGSGEYGVGYFEVQDGPHYIEGDKNFGLYQYGFSGPASYGNPGGLNLIKTQQ